MAPQTAAGPFPSYPRHTVIAFLFAEWAFMFGTWILFVANEQLGDLLLGVLASLIAALAASVLKRQPLPVLRRIGLSCRKSDVFPGTC